MRIKIKNIELKNFMSVKQLSVDFTELTVICGQNGSGKTTIVDAFMWLLFNKDSHGDEKFNIRPVIDGERVDFVDISVSATLEVDGKEVLLSKTQKQKCVKKRGSGSQELQGNENIYEVNGFPKTEREFKEFISGIVDEKTFRMITSPTYFPTLDWKEQRKVLTRFASDISDIDLANEDEKFKDLVTDIENAPDTDAIKAKYQKAATAFKKRQSEIPARIDELENMKIDIDVAELELQKSATIKEIAEIEKRIMMSGTEVEVLKQQAFDTQFEMNECRRSLLDSAYKDNQSKYGELTELKSKLSKIESSIEIKKNNAEVMSKKIEKLDSDRKSLGNEYKAKKTEEFTGKLSFNENEWVFDEKSTICPACGRELPEERIEEIKSDFEIRKVTAKEDAEKKLADDFARFNKEKSEKLASLVNAGSLLKQEAEKLRNQMLEDVALVSEAEKEKEVLEKKISDIEKSITDVMEEQILEKSSEYSDLLQKSTEIERKISELETSVPDNSLLEKEKDELGKSLESINDSISRYSRNADLDQRIEELQKEAREIDVKVTENERMLFLLEEFVKEKMNRLSASVNKKFEIVTWRLFEQQINGGMKECCQCMVNGIPYNKNLNSGHKIVAGLDIINALSSLENVYAPIFVDNAESVNDYNYPEMDTQLIKLKCTEDVKLKIEQKGGEV